MNISNNYTTIAGWMVTDLNLSGNELLIYAIIYGFSQDGQNLFQANRKYLAAWCNVSIETVKRCLKNLRDRGLIEQVYHSNDNMHVHYRALTPRVKIDPRVKNDPTLGSEMTLGRVENDPTLGSEMTLANNERIKTNNKNIYKEREAQKRPRAQFVPPTLEEIKQYSEEIGNQLVDPVSFFEYYSANGWIQGKNKKLRDWKAAFRLWIRREKSEKSAAADKDSSGTPIMIRTDYDMDRDDALDLLEGDP